MATAEQLNQAIGLIQNHQHADAEALLTPLLNQSAADADVWQLIALARKGQLNLTGAEIAFRQSIDLHAAPAVVTRIWTRHVGHLRYSTALRGTPGRIQPARGL